MCTLFMLNKNISKGSRINFVISPAHIFTYDDSQKVGTALWIFKIRNQFILVISEYMRVKSQILKIGMFPALEKKAASRCYPEYKPALYANLIGIVRVRVKELHWFKGNATRGPLVVPKTGNVVYSFREIGNSDDISV